MTREELIVEMLRHYNDVVDPLYSNSPGDGGGVVMMPATYNRSFKELERCLRLMRGEERKLWYSVYERYIGCRRVQKFLLKRHGRWVSPDHDMKPLPSNWYFRIEPTTDQAKVLTNEADVLIEIVNERVNPDDVKAGVTWLSKRFRGDPFLPLELLAAA